MWICPYAPAAVQCEEVCPVEVASEYNEGLNQRKAIYRRYAQAVPGTYAVTKMDRPPCIAGCPAHINIQGYVNMVSQGKYAQALDIIMDKLPLPGTLGRICPHPCEEQCRRREVDEPLAIRDLKRLAADKFDCREVEIACQPNSGKRVAIVGSGPAGLSCAYHLARQGHKSVIYEALPKAGGMLRYGIPDYRLPQEILDQDIEAVTNLGVEIRCNTPLGPDLPVDKLESEYDAVYLAIGCHKGYTLGIPGEDADGVVQGVDLLRDLAMGRDVKMGERLAVIGGGNVAMDVARSARRMGSQVTVVYRRSREEMPAWEEEIECCLDEDVKIEYLAAPVEVVTKGGKVVALKVIRMELGEPDASGRRRPMPVEGSEYEIELDMVVPAIGQAAAIEPLRELAGLEFNRNGTIKTDSVTFATGREKIFAGGDMQTGPWIAIGAVAAGEAAAVSIDRFFKGEDLAAGREPLSTGMPENDNWAPVPAGTEPQARAKMPALAVDDRCTCFEEVETGYDEDAGRAEAARCLNCGVCCECFQCVEACQAKALVHQQGPQNREVVVGSIILAGGFHPFNPGDYAPYAYSRFPNVVTALEFERVLAATGPWMGHLVRPSDEKEPQKIAWLQCVGSRDVNSCDHPYCSSVCCMYAIKEAVIAKEHSKQDLDAAVFFMDMRTFGKDFRPLL